GSHGIGPCPNKGATAATPRELSFKVRGTSQQEGKPVPRLTKTFPVFDCDAHINDPKQIWDYVPESKKELVRNIYWRTEDEAGLNGTQPVMGGGNRHFAPSYNSICIAGPQRNTKIKRKLL